MSINTRAIIKRLRALLRITRPDKLMSRDYILNIENHINDGFKKVCNVDTSSTVDRWHYTDIDHSIMFSEHTSWVYALTLDNTIYKIGESANVLGYRPNTSYDHPATGTKGRLSRYITGDGTDKDIRAYMQTYIDSGRTISIWAKKCDISFTNISMCGEIHTVESTSNKSQELLFLDMINKTGGYPVLNKSRK